MQLKVQDLNFSCRLCFSSIFSSCYLFFFSFGILIKYIEDVPQNLRFYSLEKHSVTISYGKLLLMRQVQFKKMNDPLFFDIQILPPYFGIVKS